MSKDQAAAAVFEELSFDDLESADTATMTVIANNKPTNWTWTFAGPGHPKTVEQMNKMQRERLHRDAQQEAARVNGRKWKAAEETVDEVRDRNVSWIVGRLLDWSPIKIDGEVYPFSEANAKKLLLDPKKMSLMTQALEFLVDEQAFTKRSAAS